MLPPGAARLFTKPEPTGSKFCRKIIGIVCVSCMTAAVTGVEMTTITLGSNATSSLARAFIASTEPPAHRFSIRTLRPSVHPNACSPWTSAALFRSPSESPATSDRNMATRGRRAGCCARAASGHAAAPPSSVMKSRRLRSDEGLPPTVPPPIIKPAAEAHSRFASPSSLPVEDEPPPSRLPLALTLIVIPFDPLVDALTILSRVKNHLYGRTNDELVSGFRRRCSRDSRLRCLCVCACRCTEPTHGDHSSSELRQDCIHAIRASHQDLYLSITITRTSATRFNNT